MKITAFLMLFYIAAPAFAQQAEHFKVPIARVKGDLNKDGLEDLVTVMQNGQDNAGTYKLEIYFARPGGKMALIVSSTKAIEPGKEVASYGKSLGEITIANGVLTINEDLLRGNYNHKFRYQNGHFELIGYTEISSDGQGKMYSTDFNLSTGVRIEKVESYETDKVFSNKRSKVMIRPLPRLQDFEPYKSELY